MCETHKKSEVDKEENSKRTEKILSILNNFSRDDKKMNVERMLIINYDDDDDDTNDNDIVKRLKVKHCQSTPKRKKSGLTRATGTV